MGELRGEHVPELARLLGEPCRLCRSGDRHANRAAVDAGPGFEREALGEPRQPAVGPVSRHRGAKERKREVVGPDRHGGPTDGHRLVGTGHGGRRHLPDPSDDLPTPMDGIDERERRQALRIVGRHGEPLDDRRHVVPRPVVQLVPVGPHRHRAEGFEGSPVVAAIGEVLGDAREAPDRGRAGPGPRERLEVERRPRGLVRRKPTELERCAKEPHGLLRAAELVREIARPREPQRAQPRIGGEPGTPLQRRERDVEPAANPRPIRRGVERRGDLLVRPFCGRRPMPDRAVRIACQRPRERGVRQPALLAGCRVMDRRPDQRVPEPECAVVERPQAGCDGPRPGVDVDGRSEQRFGRATQLGELAVIERREQQQRSHVGVQSGEPPGERRLEPSRQRQRLRCAGQLELTAAAGSSIRASGLPAASARIRPFSSFGQAGPVQLEERARRVVVEPGKGELGEPGLVEIAGHAVADGDEHDHRLHLEPPREERQHLGR